MTHAWTKKQMTQHVHACTLLNKIKNEAFTYLQTYPSATEHETQQFILKKFRQNHLVPDKDPPIVGFRGNAANPHYFPKKKSSTLREDSVVLIDIWARLREAQAPFSDITWMGYKGTIPPDVQRGFDTVCEARDAALAFIKRELVRKKIPTGKAIDETVHAILVKNGYANNILHRTGHSIGLTSPHGIFRNINKTGTSQLIPGLGYTIEPGLYFKNKFGIRSEIDFFISTSKKLIVTTPIQRKIIKI